MFILCIYISGTVVYYQILPNDQLPILPNITKVVYYRHLYYQIFYCCCFNSQTLAQIFFSLKSKEKLIYCWSFQRKSTYKKTPRLIHFHLCHEISKLWKNYLPDKSHKYIIDTYEDLYWTLSIYWTYSELNNCVNINR